MPYDPLMEACSNFFQSFAAPWSHHMPVRSSRSATSCFAHHDVASKTCLACLLCNEKGVVATLVNLRRACHEACYDFQCTKSGTLSSSTWRAASLFLTAETIISPPHIEESLLGIFSHIV